MVSTYASIKALLMPSVWTHRTQRRAKRATSRPWEKHWRTRGFSPSLPVTGQRSSFYKCSVKVKECRLSGCRLGVFWRKRLVSNVMKTVLSEHSRSNNGSLVKLRIRGLVFRAVGVAVGKGWLIWRNDNQSLLAANATNLPVNFVFFLSNIIGWMVSARIR